MMDIVEWLRQFKLSTFDSNYNALFVNGKTKEAADEIERLREDKAELLEALTGLYEVCCWEKVAPEIDAAKAAIAKATGGK